MSYTIKCLRQFSLLEVGIGVGLIAPMQITLTWIGQVVSHRLPPMIFSEPHHHISRLFRYSTPKLLFVPHFLVFIVE